MFLLASPTVAPRSWWLFYLSRHEVRVVRLLGAAWKVVAWWPMSPTALSAFREFAQGLAGAAVMVLVESEDVVIQNEKIPLLFGQDRAGLILRKLNTLGHNPEQALSHYHSLGRVVGDKLEHNGKTLESLLLLALADSANFLPWIVTLRDAGALIFAVTTPSLVFASMAKQSTAYHEGLALQAIWGSAGLTQTVLDKGLPLLSRHCPWPNDIHHPTDGWQIDPAIQIITAQTQKLLSYLQGRGWWSASVTTPLSIVMPASVPMANLQWPAMAGIEWRTVQAPELLMATSVQAPPNPSPSPPPQGGETLILTQMSTLSPLVQVAPNAIRQRYRHWRSQRYLWRALIIVWAILAAVLIYQGGWWAYYAYGNANTTAATQDLVSAYRDKRKSFPSLGITTQDLRGAYRIGESTQLCHPPLPDALLKISQMNVAHPAIDLLALSWQTVTDYERTHNLPDKQAQCALSLELKGQLHSVGLESQREVQETFNRWIEALKALEPDNALQVSITSAPLNVSQGKFNESNQKNAKLPFTVTVQWQGLKSWETAPQ